MESGYVFAVGAAVVWGLAYAIDQRILAELPPTVFLFSASLLAAIILLPFVLSDRAAIANALSLDKETWMLVLVTVLLGTFANLLILMGIRSLGAPVASMLEIAYPFFVTLFCVLFFGASPNAWFFVGGTLIFSGVMVIIRFA